MPDLTPEIVDDVLSACKEGADEAAEAFGRALDAKMSLSVGEHATIDLAALPEGLDGPGLAIVLTIGDHGVLVALPESDGLVPAWCESPDPTGESKLTTLGQELGMVLLPEAFMPDDFKVARVKNLAGALRRGGVADGAALVALELASDEKKGPVVVIWPAPKPEAIIGAAMAKSKAPPKKEAPAKPASKAAPKPQPAAPAPPKRSRTLPGYTRSLLRIKVPVVVTLAEKRQPLGRVVELGPGSIIQFEKSCEDMLELGIGDLPIANGEAVKVGDKFGLRLTSMILPEERFRLVKPLAQAK